MSYIFSILLGIIQGLTEFLPVSSSGHLVFLHHLFDFNLENNLSFDVALHLGTLVALVVYFWKDLVSLLMIWLKSFKYISQISKPKRQLIYSGVLNKEQILNSESPITAVSGKINHRQVGHWQVHLVWGIFLGTLPAVLVGFYLESYIQIMFYNLFWVALALIVVGILFLLIEKKHKDNKDQLNKITIIKSFWIGCAQALALLPGISRSGITIIAGMKQGLTRLESARFSFLLSVPVVLGAGINKVIDFIAFGNISDELGITLVGFFVSAIVGYFCIKYFLQFVQKYSLNLFAYYRFILGILILFWVFI